MKLFCTGRSSLSNQKKQVRSAKLRYLACFLWAKYMSDQSHASAYEQPSCQGKGTQKSGEHDHTGRKGSIIVHIFGHNKAAYRCCRTQHDDNGHQFIVRKAHGNSCWKEYNFKSCKL